MKKRLLAAGAAAMLTLTACGGQAEGYEDVNELAAAYGEVAGVECSETSNDVDDNGWVQTTCGDTGVVMMFTSDEKREEIMENNPLESGERYLQSDDWLIVDSQFRIEEAQAALGGEVIEP